MSDTYPEPKLYRLETDSMPLPFCKKIVLDGSFTSFDCYTVGFESFNAGKRLTKIVSRWTVSSASSATTARIARTSGWRS